MSAVDMIDHDPPVWTDDETAEPAESEPTAGSGCTKCGRSLEAGEVDVCNPCWRAEEDALRSVARAVQAPDPTIASGQDLAETVAEFARQQDAALAASPHRCAGGCGARMLRAGSWCETCDARKRDEQRRKDCVAATRYSVPPRYKWARFDAPEFAQRVRDRAAIAQAKKVAQNPKIDRISLFGPAGLGKTSTAVATMIDIAHARRLRGLYVDARSLSLARSQHSLGSEPEIVSDAMRADVLLLDDLGLDNPQQHGSAIVDVIYRRHAEAMLTIVTLAIAPGEVAGLYGDGFGRRLIEDDGARTLIEVKG